MPREAISEGRNFFFHDYIPCLEDKINIARVKLHLPLQTKFFYSLSLAHEVLESSQVSIYVGFQMSQAACE